MAWVTTSDPNEYLDIDLSNNFVVRPWGYDGPPAYDPHAHLYGDLAEIDYGSVPYGPIESYPVGPIKGVELAGSWMGFAPHYDDELSFALLIPYSIRQGIKFHIVQTTAGDGNAHAVARYFKKPCGPIEHRESGYIRRQETLFAMRHLGVKEEQIIHLGLPDGGLAAIFEKHKSAANPFLAYMVGTDRVPYDFAYKPNLPFSRDQILEVFKDLVRKHSPKEIFTPHPDERHVDHRATTFFVLEALRQLEKEGIERPRVHVWVAYGPGDFPEAPYRYKPEEWDGSNRDFLLWHQATWAYQTQGPIIERGGRRLPIDKIRQEYKRTIKWYLLEQW